MIPLGENLLGLGTIATTPDHDGKLVTGPAKLGEVQNDVKAKMEKAFKRK